MSEQLPEPPPPRTYHVPVTDDPALARKNLLLGLALFGIFLLLFAGVIVVALVYNAVSSG